MAEITVKPFGRMPDGSDVKLFILSNDHITAHFIEYGAVLQRLIMRDKKGTVRDVVLGYPDLEGYLKGTDYFGATVGRFANRIRGGRFTLGGNEYILDRNENGNTLHGGTGGFSTRVFNGCIDNTGVCFSLISPDGDQGFPGALDLKVHVLLEDNSLTFLYKYTCTKDCPVSLTHHSYLNLNGAGDATAANHDVTIYAEKYCKQDEDHLPVVPPVPVAGTPFDFTKPAKISSGILSRVTQLRIAKGYDHCYATGQDHCATVSGDKSGITLDVYSDYPAMQFYDGSGVGHGGVIKGKQNLPYRKRYGICFEPQFFPNSPNEDYFPSSVAEAGKTYTKYIRYSFSGIL